LVLWRVYGGGLLVSRCWLLVGGHRLLVGGRRLLVCRHRLLSELLLPREEHGTIHRRCLLTLVRRFVAHVARLVLIVRGRGYRTRNSGTVRGNAFEAVRVLVAASVLGVARSNHRGSDSNSASVEGVTVVRAVTRESSSRAKGTRDVQIRRESSAHLAAASMASPQSGSARKDSPHPPSTARDQLRLPRGHRCCSFGDVRCCC